MPISALREISSAIEDRRPVAVSSLEPLDAESRLLVAIVISALEPALLASPADVFAAARPVDLQLLVAPALAERWMRAMIAIGALDVVATVIARHPLPTGAVARVAATLAREERIDDALVVARAMPWFAKSARSLALVDVALAARRDDLVDEALAAIVETEPITTGAGRGYDELELLVALLDRTRALGAEHPVVARAVGHVVRLGRAGQRQSEPTAFSEALARAAQAHADAAGAGSSGWLAHAEAVRREITFADVAAKTDTALAAARARIDRGSAAPAASPSAAVAARPPEDWRADGELRTRARAATEEMVRALDQRDSRAVLDLLEAALTPSAGSYAARLEAWARATGPERERASLEVLRLEPTPADHWCAQAPEAVWDSLAVITTPEHARAALEMLFDRDYVARAHPGVGGWRTPRSIAVVAIAIADRLADRGSIERVLEALASSSRPKIDHRLFEAIASATAAGAFDLARWDARIAGERRWALWGAVPLLRDVPLAEIEARFGKPAKESIHAVARALALSGRVDDAIAAAAHPSAHWTEHGRPPPTQDALLEIARSGVMLEPKQASTIVARFRKAPRLRDAHGRASSERLGTELDALLAERARE